MATPIGVLIVEDQRATREGLATLVAGTPGLELCGAHASMELALAAFERESPDVALLDIGLPGMSGIEGVRRLKARKSALAVLMLTVFADNDSVFDAVCAGACGYLLKDTPPARLVEAIHELAHGGAPMSPEIARKVVTMFAQTAPKRETEHGLTPREREILELLSDGHSYKTAAHALDIAIDTVRFHIRHIYEKLHVHSKSEAVVAALRKGIVR